MVADSHSVSVTYQPQLDNGLLLMLSNSSNSLLLAVGMFNGEVSSLHHVTLCDCTHTPLSSIQLRIADFSNGSMDSYESLGQVCDPVNSTTYNFTLTYGSTLAEASVMTVQGDGAMNTQIPFLPDGSDQLLLDVGNIPRNKIPYVHNFLFYIHMGLGGLGWS